MKIIKRIIAATSILALIVCAIVGIQKGLFNESFKQLNKNNTVVEGLENTTLNETEIQTLTTSAKDQNAIANAPRIATFNDSFFYKLGDDISFTYLPSLFKGEMMVNVRRTFISDEPDAAALEYLEDPGYFSRKFNERPNSYVNGYFLISVEIQFTNVSTTKISWGMGDCRIGIFDKNGKVDTQKEYGSLHQCAKISGDGVFKNGEIFLQPGETALCKWAGMIGKNYFDSVKDNSQQIYFIPSDMYYRSASSSTAPGKLAFVELNLEVN